MRTLNDLLRDADPLRDEPLPDPAERRRVHRAVLAAAPAVGAQGPAAGAGAATLAAGTIISRRTALASLAAIAAVAVGVRFWSAGAPTVHAAVRFEVRLAELAFSPGLHEARVAGTNRAVYLHQEAVLTNTDIMASRVVPGNAPTHFSVSVTLTSAGAEKMRQASAGHLGRPMAILIDGEVVMAPTVRSVMSNESLITGDFSRAEAQRIADGMMVR